MIIFEIFYVLVINAYSEACFYLEWGWKNIYEALALREGI